MTSELDALLDHASIDRLQRAYADGVTRRDWEQVRGLFLPDATISLDLVTRPAVQLAGPKALTDFVSTALESFSFFQFVILNSHIEPSAVDPAAAKARMFMSELRLKHGASQREDTYGLYRDTYRKTDQEGYGGWRFASRWYRTVARFPDNEVFPLDP
ncbi:MAG TPA: nuclear transport factor 2 family protein [Acidimicrobiales bacterium]|nr:nuclear transport factor 2 family protein [Acidimicrobiales bacterium]